jgi:hypothetical protein
MDDGSYHVNLNLKIYAVENKFIFDLHFVGWVEQG